MSGACGVAVPRFDPDAEGRWHIAATYPRGAHGGEERTRGERLEADRHALLFLQCHSGQPARSSRNLHSGPGDNGGDTDTKTAVPPSRSAAAPRPGRLPRLVPTWTAGAGARPGRVLAFHRRMLREIRPPSPAAPRGPVPAADGRSATASSASAADRAPAVRKRPDWRKAGRCTGSPPL